MNTGKPGINRRCPVLAGVLVAITLPLAGASLAAQNQSRNWDVEGLNGELRAYGMLVSAPCVLAPESREQEINTGTTVMSTLQKTGDVTPPVDIHLVLNDCPGGIHRLSDPQTLRGGLWLSDQGMVKMRITGLADAHDSRFFQVSGASGVSLRIADMQGHILSPAVSGRPLPLAQGRNDLVLRAQLMRTPGPLDAGVWRAVMHIDMEYE